MRSKELKISRSILTLILRFSLALLTLTHALLTLLFLASFTGHEKTFELPDTSVVTVHNQLIRVPELMLDPWVDGRDITSIPELCVKSVNDCDADLHKELFDNVVLSGGSTAFPNFRLQMEQKLQRLTHHAVVVQSFNDPYPSDLYMHQMNMATLCPASPASFLSHHIRQKIASYLPVHCFHPLAAHCMAGLKYKALPVPTIAALPPNADILESCWPYDHGVKGLVGDFFARGGPVPSAWLGGSILTSLSTFDHMWINSQTQYGATPPTVGYVSAS